MRISKIKLFTLLLLPIASFAQEEIKVSGTVKSSIDNSPLNGVDIYVDGTTYETITDENGFYEIVVPDNSTLTITYDGYEIQTIPVNKKGIIDIKLKDLVATEQQNLNEVVVIGYTTVTRDELTGSVASVNADQIKDMAVNSAAEAIQGRLAGVQVSMSEGAPGADVTIKVRGGTSITQDNSPLYIVDGIQVENALSILSPQEIASIDVLKDAASTAIYGARGANGVVLITTKSGFNMPTQVTYSNYTGFREIQNKLEVMTPYEFVRYQYELYNINNDEQLANSFRKRYGDFSDIDIYKSMEARDWQEEVFGRKAFSQNHNVSLVGGNKSTDFSLNLNHINEDGIMLNSGYKRNLANFKLNHKISDKVKTGVSFRYSKDKIMGAGTSNTGSQSNNRLRNSVRYQPFAAPGNESYVDFFDPDYYAQTNLTSPVLLANNEVREDERQNLLMNGYLSWQIVKGLTFKSVFGYVQTDRNDNSFYGNITSVAMANANLPVVDLRASQTRRISNSNTLQYSPKLGSNHKLDVMIGQEIVKTDGETSRTYIKWLPKNILAHQAFSNLQSAVPPAGMVQDPVSTSVNVDRLASFFGQVNYSFNKKYMLTLSVRTDGSSVFSPDNRYATFPSASFAWNVARENFLKDSSWIDELKLRLSYGTSGNNRIEPFLYSTFFSSSSNWGYSFDNAVVPGLAPNERLANSGAKWEKTISKNIGLDYTLFNKRVYGSIDAYITNTKDLLLLAKIPQTGGYEYQYQNSGETENKGIEFTIGADIAKSKNFKWNVNFNISHNQNVIKSLGKDVTGDGLQYYYQSSGWVNNLQDFKVEVGKPIGQFYGYVTDGWYKVSDFDYNASTQKYTLKAGVASNSAAALGSKDVRPGDLKLKDLNNDGIIDDNDKTVLGNAQPKFYGGFNQQFQWKNIDLSMFFTYSVGNKVYNANKIEFTTQYLYRDNNMLKAVAGAWRNFDDNGNRVTDPTQLEALNANATFWSPPSGNYILHSYAIEDGSYLRLSNVTVGYSLPEDMLAKTKFISKVRIYATINNLFTITGYSGYDPEANTRRTSPLTPGVDYAAYPRSRFFLTGINVTF
ncbi:SusC/RagA family TonB-linked outer membrane protein [Empedobacter falsenii]